MFLLTSLYSTILEALFPIPHADRELFSRLPESAYGELPRAPAYAGLTVPLEGTASIFAYKDPQVKALVWNIKYKRSARAVGIAGHALYRVLSETAGRNAFGLNPVPLPAILIPIPISTRRRNERGFNQCELLVDEIRRLDTAGLFIVEKDLLVRPHHDARHTLKDRNERLKSSAGIFSVNENKILKQTMLVVIDDVITTGSTMKEAMDTLKAAGFENVHGLSLAH